MAMWTWLVVAVLLTAFGSKVRRVLSASSVNSSWPLRPTKLFLICCYGELLDWRSALARRARAAYERCVFVSRAHHLWLLSDMLQLHLH